jgi:hypothetical protein
MEKSPDPRSGKNISEIIFQLKILKFFNADADPRSFVNHRSGIRDGKTRIGDKYPGSTTLPDGPLGLNTPAAQLSDC